MMNAKDLARKMLAGCGHTQAIIIPHDECIETRLAQWEAAIRLDCARTLANEHRQAIDYNNAEVDKAKQEVEKLNRKVESSERSMAVLREINTQIGDKLRIALAEIDDLRARLSAENRQNHHIKYPMAISE